MIQVKRKDTIIDIIEKMQNEESQTIILDFPVSHPTLHNYISLKILKSKAQWKKLVIRSNDLVWKKIGKNLWITYSSVKNPNFLENKDSNLIQHNYSFWEYFKYQIALYLKETKNIILWNKRLNTFSFYSQKYKKNNALHIFIWLLIFSVLLFICIYYIAINKTYVYINPETIIKKEAYNFILQENVKNSILWDNKFIEINKISENFVSSHTYAATNIIRDSNSISSWIITLYNETTEVITLVPKTRVMSEDWIIFEIEEWTKIPPAEKDNFWVSPWSTSVKVISRLLDSQWWYIGTRWNIKQWTKLQLPGLSQDFQKLIYAQAENGFTWWSDKLRRTISQEDITNAKELFLEKLKTESFESLKNNIINRNSLNNTKNKLLTNQSSITYSAENINIEQSVSPWDEVDNFTLRWNITVSAYVYNSESIIQRLKSIISEKTLSPIEKIVKIDEDSLRISQIIYTQKSPYEIKATFEIESLFLFDFLNDNNSYLEQLKNKIRWLQKQEAESILLNDKKISNATIEIRPFFVNFVSNIQNNIIIKVQ